MSLPYPAMDFVPFDILTAEELDHVVANIQSVSTGTGFSLGNNVIPANALATNAITLSTIASSTSQGSIGNSPVILTGLTTNVTIPAGGRKVYVYVTVPNFASSAISVWSLYIYNSATVTGSYVQRKRITQPITAGAYGCDIWFEHTPSAGSQSYCAAISVDSGVGVTSLSATEQAFLTVKLG